MTRSTVQKAVVVLAAKPVFGPIRCVFIRKLFLFVIPMVFQGTITCGDYGLVPSKVLLPSDYIYEEINFKLPGIFGIRVF